MCSYTPTDKREAVFSKRAVLTKDEREPPESALFPYGTVQFNHSLLPRMRWIVVGDAIEVTFNTDRSSGRVR